MRHFNKLGIQRLTGTKYNEKNLDRNWYLKFRNDYPNGYTIYGYNKNCYDRDGYDMNGFNELGIDKFTGCNVNHDGETKKDCDTSKLQSKTL
ncbi:MAG: hypothetical protein ACRCZR_05305 [Cetobacterium sp.]|uniref:hypothetical protein n=1 Tax=Cetobacterium sp. TaxID=2071632 RepID=UPI003F2EF36D